MDLQRNGLDLCRSSVGLQRSRAFLQKIRATFARNGGDHVRKIVISVRIRAVRPRRKGDSSACPYFTPRTKSESSMRSALAMLSNESNDAVRCPFSKREIKTTDKPVFSANCSWVRLTCLRNSRRLSPKMRRCFGTEGTSHPTRKSGV